MTNVRLHFVAATVLVLATVCVVPAYGQDERDLSGIDARLGAGLLAEQPNPVVLEFLLSDGRQHLTGSQYQQAFD